MFYYDISFPDFDPSPAVTAAIENRIHKLANLYGRIISCEVFVRSPHRHSRKRNFNIQIRLKVPGNEVIVNRERERDLSHQNIYVAIRDAFNALTRQLDGVVNQRRIRNKPRVGPAHGRVIHYNPYMGFGFLITPEGRELYFHENSLVGVHKDHLEVGCEVRYVEEMGEKGPQASSMSLVGNQGHKSLKSG